MELPAPSFDGNALFGLPEHLTRTVRRAKDVKQEAAQFLGQRRELPRADAPKSGLSMLALRSGR